MFRSVGIMWTFVSIKHSSPRDVIIASTWLPCTAAHAYNHSTWAKTGELPWIYASLGWWDPKRVCTPTLLDWVVLYWWGFTSREQVFSGGDLNVSLKFLQVLIFVHRHIRYKRRLVKMTQWVKALEASPDDLSSIPGVDIAEENWHSFKLSSDLHT